MMSAGNKRKRVEEEEDSMLRKTEYLKTSEKAEAKESEGTQEIVQLAEVEEVERRMEGETPVRERSGVTWIPSMSDGREDELNYMVKTQCGSSKVCKAPTTTKWIDRVKKDDDGREFVRCRLVARYFKSRREGPRDELFAAMPPQETKKELFVFVAGVWEKRRERGQDEFINVKKAHLNAKRKRGAWHHWQRKTRRA